MPSALNEALAGREGAYLLPFFWQHGADEETLRAMMGRIWESNAREVCVESRPHPDFCGPQWWRDMDIILDEAQKRDMRVWVLDDKQFPTGNAGGLLAKKYPEHRHRLLSYYAIDAQGPLEHASFLPQSLVNNANRGRLEAVVAAKRRSDGADWRAASCDVSDLIDLTPMLQDGRLYWDVPEGLYTVFVVYSFTDSRLDLLNPISKQAVLCQIEGCYEPHFQRYGQLFGKTFAGFFSDEPQFAVGIDWVSLPGRDMNLPWSDELREALSSRLGDDYRASLPCLWLDGDERVRRVRYAYMDEASRLFADCMCQTLGDWCHAHGVEYIGHQVEDNNSHSRLGSGAGHFFRAQCAQDMAGADIVMHQIHPGYDQISRHWHSAHTLTDGEFFHYALIKLAASEAHIDPAKRGRALVENFGAYGWMEGTRLMKWLADHCMVRGANYFTPHAFTDSAFPEWDSPPHFYAQGHNPQFRFVGHLFRYMNRVCHLLSGGTHLADALVLYQADGEWWGDGMLSQKPMRELMRRQIDFDVIPCDAVGDVACEHGELRLNGERYRSFVIPGAGALPRRFLERLSALSERGARIFFVDRKPELDTDGLPLETVPGETVPLCELARRIEEQGLCALRVVPACPRLRVYRYARGGETYTMFFNEEPRNAVRFSVELPEDGPYARYDAMNNRLYRQPCEGRRVTLALEAYESLILVAGSAEEGEILPETEDQAREIDAKWRVSLAAAEAPERFEPYEDAMALCDINGAQRLPNFTGVIRYEAAFEAERAGMAQIHLREVYETAEVWLNGEYLGFALSAPYRFRGALKTGRNELRVEVTNTLAKQVADFSSAIVPQEPGGLLAAPSYAYVK